VEQQHSRMRARGGVAPEPTSMAEGVWHPSVRARLPGHGPWPQGRGHAGYRGAGAAGRGAAASSSVGQPALTGRHVLSTRLPVCLPNVRFGPPQPACSASLRGHGESSHAAATSAAMLSYPASTTIVRNAASELVGLPRA
jgi:hypothetical protein